MPEGRPGVIVIFFFSELIMGLRRRWFDVIDRGQDREFESYEIKASFENLSVVVARLST